MAQMHFMTFLGVVWFLCLSHNGIADGGTNVDLQEDLELERQLNILKKQPIKTIKTKLGHIYDCIDIYQQPSLDHPLLKNHKVQTKPIFPQQRLAAPTSFSSNNSNAIPVLVNCPRGTVPIRRTEKEDLRRIKAFTESYTAKIQPQTKGHPGKQFAILKINGDQSIYYGAGAHINVQQPQVASFQSSASQLSVERTFDGEFNSLQAGLIVSPQLYGDHYTHLFGLWQTSKPDGNQDGCFNIKCRGFVQTESNIPVDTVVSPVSVYGGHQYGVDLQIVQDKQLFNWWLIYNRTRIGYWPNSIVLQLSRHGATYLAWGGTTSEIPEGPSPPLGNGKVFDHDRFDPTRQSWFRNIKVFDREFNEVDPGKDEVETYVDNNDCYGGWDWGYIDTRQEHVFSFGGPGGNCGI